MNGIGSTARVADGGRSGAGVSTPASATRILAYRSRVVVDLRDKRGAVMEASVAISEWSCCLDKKRAKIACGLYNSTKKSAGDCDGNAWLATVKLGLWIGRENVKTYGSRPG